MDPSWQYELSLLRNRNEKLRAEVGAMERERKTRRKHRRKLGCMSPSAPARARLINGVDSVGWGPGLGFNHQQWVLQQHPTHAHEEASKAANTKAVVDVHMSLSIDEHSSSLKRKREMAGFEIGAPPPPTWNPGGELWGV
jgi:hypothetical protein